MIPVLALITGWALLAPLLLLLWVNIGGAIPVLLVPIVTIANSVPMLAACTVAGLAMLVWSILRLAGPADDLEPPPSSAR